MEINCNHKRWEAVAYAGNKFGGFKVMAGLVGEDGEFSKICKKIP